MIAAGGSDGNGNDLTRGAGGGALGARLRRLSEQIDRDAARVYAARGIGFEQRWFGPLNQLVRGGPQTVGEIAERLRITHVSVSQAMKSLEAAGWIAARPDPDDGRRRLLSLTPRGRSEVNVLKPLWTAFEAAAEALDAEAGGVVAALDRLDDALAQASLFERIGQHMEGQARTAADSHQPSRLA